MNKGYLKTAVPKLQDGVNIKIEVESYQDSRKTVMRKGKVFQRTLDCVIVEFPYKVGGGSFKEGFQVVDLANGNIKWEVIA